MAGMGHCGAGCENECRKQSLFEPRSYAHINNEICWCDKGACRWVTKAKEGTHRTDVFTTVTTNMRPKLACQNLDIVPIGKPDAPRRFITTNIRSTSGMHRHRHTRIQELTGKLHQVFTTETANMRPKTSMPESKHDFDWRQTFGLP